MNPFKYFFTIKAVDFSGRNTCQHQFVIEYFVCNRCHTFRVYLPCPTSQTDIRLTHQHKAHAFLVRLATTRLEDARPRDGCVLLKFLFQEHNNSLPCLGIEPRV